MSWLRIREMVRKEFIQLFRDKRSRPILVIAPLIQLLVFGYVVNYDIKDIRVALIDQCPDPGKPHDDRRLHRKRDLPDHQPAGQPR